MTSSRPGRSPIGAIVVLSLVAALVCVRAVPPPSSSAPLPESYTRNLFPDRGGGKTKGRPLDHASQSSSSQRSSASSWKRNATSRRTRASKQSQWNIHVDSSGKLPTNLRNSALSAFSGKSTVAPKRSGRGTAADRAKPLVNDDPVEEIIVDPRADIDGVEHILVSEMDADHLIESSAGQEERKVSAASRSRSLVRSLLSSPKIENFRNRLGPAVFMVTTLYLFSKKFKEDGLILLACVLQAGLYEETSLTIGGPNMNPVNKWWWFLAYAYATNAPRLLPWATKNIAIRSYGMVLLGLVANIFRFKMQQSGTNEFREWIRETVVAAISLVLTVAPAAYWIALLEEYGMAYVYYGAALVAINDTMAYVFGMTMGRHAILPTISSKKTWEGFIGAGLSTMWCGYALLQKTSLDAFVDLTPSEGLVLGLFASTVAPFGGFLASVIKRAYNKKDFGTILGKGHGGLVDRLDCQLVMAPFLYLFLRAMQVRTSYD